MLKVDVPGSGELCCEHLVLDLNGTLTLDGQLIEGVAERLGLLRRALSLYLLTADTRGSAAALGEKLGVAVQRIASGDEGRQKRAFVQSLGAEKVVAIGNGRNDAEMLAAASLGIAVIGEEGAAGPTILAADVVCRHICDALDLLLIPIRLVSTIRK